MEMKVETLPKQRIVFVRQIGPYGPSNMQAMEKLKKWAEENNLTNSATIFGVPQDNPEITRPENCRYDACIAISKDYQMDDSVSEGELSGGEYAVFKVKHTADDVQKAWDEIFPAIQNSGYQMDNKPIIERYTGEMVNNDYCELCVPVKSL
ncbi:GyrI-like domain-containing protein [Radiobacillus kanasensis]|uniref:AraC family transcriptional regulator n=1 Tax=Radiobacillus kanasensis TaxID=2844358 RepID=UPI001E412134|nr:GyrI-like domain-containing protein [Radiobacillus kanasensis]UFT99962.1 GyrI-like domain-containing protein [Radiobacillus kanasensis]